MKWHNKGHEFDNYAAILLEIFRQKKNRIYIFGAGSLGEDLAPVFEKYQCFGGYIDNDICKQRTGVNGRKVISLQQYMQQGSDGIVVIAADLKNIPVIESQLMIEGLKRDKDFWIYTDFMKKEFPILALYQFDAVYVELAQICLTERCTLKCRDCAHGCFAVGAESKDLDIETVQRSVDSFFSKVWLIKEFVFIGGEPFLYNNLEQAVQYVGSKYRDRMITFSITTNGTIVPQDRILDLCREFNILIRISNYSGMIKRLEEKYRQLTRHLKDHQVSYVMGNSELQWMNYGFQTVNHGENEEKRIQVFDQCGTPCREIRGNKYYYCVMARSVSDNLGLGVGREDYLDLDELGDDGRKIFLEFDYGYSEKGYMDMCVHCNGADAVQYRIPAAVQVEQTQ